MSLLDPSIKCYIVEKSKSQETVNFFNENGKVLGNLRNDNKKEFFFIEPSGDIIINLRKPRLPFMNYIIYYNNQRFQANFKSKKEVFLWNMSDSDSLEISGDFFIYQISEKDLTLARASRLKQTFYEPKFEYDFSRSYILEIINEPKDRVGLLSLFIAMIEDFKVGYNEIEEYLGSDDYNV